MHVQHIVVLHIIRFSRTQRKIEDCRKRQAETRLRVRTSNNQQQRIRYSKKRIQPATQQRIQTSSSSTMAILPPPMDDRTVADPLQCPPLRWGILGCGRVSHDFTQALKHLPTQTVTACAARSADSAVAFAEKHGVARSYGGYDGLLDDGEVDIVYVGNIHRFRRETAEKCINAGKHVLVEKPFACSVEDGQYLIDLAKKKGVFVMEGMWTRFFPAVQKARDIATGSGDSAKKLGEVVQVISDFNFNAADSETYPDSFLYNRKLGGGSSLVVGPYPLAAATMFFPNSEPDQIKAVGQLDATTGVDLQVGMTMSFPPTSNVQPAMDESNVDESTPKLPGAGVAVLSFGVLCESVEETTMIGTKGRMTLQSPGHCPTRLTVDVKADGRGAKAESNVYEYALPEDTEEIKKAGGYFYPNSAGFAYEAAGVARCIAAGKLEAPQFTLDETMLNLKLMDEARRQIGVASVDAVNGFH